jgi:predicted nuclease of predicted toxin-antitoxin system
MKTPNIMKPSRLLEIYEETLEMFEDAGVSEVNQRFNKKYSGMCDVFSDMKNSKMITKDEKDFAVEFLLMEHKPRIEALNCSYFYVSGLHNIRVRHFKMLITKLKKIKELIGDREVCIEIFEYFLKRVSSESSKFDSILDKERVELLREAMIRFCGYVEVLSHFDLMQTANEFHQMVSNDPRLKKGAKYLIDYFKGMTHGGMSKFSYFDPLVKFLKDYQIRQLDILLLLDKMHERYRSGKYMGLCILVEHKDLRVVEYVSDKIKKDLVVINEGKPYVATFLFKAREFEPRAKYLNDWMEELLKNNNMLLDYKLIFDLDER